MLQLRALGALSLRREHGGEVGAVLAQPKRIALLLHLAIHGGLHRRDHLLGLFWADSDEARARAALSQALHYLRRSLGSGVIVSRGKDEVGVDPTRLWCDVVDFDQAVESGDPEGLRAALRLYRGDLLPGFHLSDAAEFERWLERERQRLRRRAAEAGWSLAGRAASEGRLAEALIDGRQALELSDYSEERLRWMIDLLDRAGDPAAALALYGEVAERLAEEYELEPTARTREMISALRARAASDESQTRDRTLTSAPDGSVPAPPADAAGPTASPRRAGHWIPFAAVAAGVLAVVGGAGLLLPGTQVPAAEQQADAPSAAFSRVAVLPFANFSRAPDEAYLADAVTAELISRLSRLRDLRVIALTSVMVYRDSTKSVADIGRDLRVRTIVEGSVLTFGDSVRIGVRIIDAVSEEPVWSRDYDAHSGEALALQRRIAEEVAVALKVETRPAAERWWASTQPDAVAYDAYQRGRSLLGRIDGPSLLQALEHFRAAVERDSTLAPAWSGLAQAYNQLAADALLAAGEAYPLARLAAERALRLDDELAEAHAALATVRSGYDWDARGAEAHFRRALELDPSHAEAYRAYANHLRNLGRFGEALEILRKAQDLDPQSPLPVLEEGILLYMWGRHDPAIAVAQRLLREHPQSHRAWFLLAMIRTEKRELSAALAALEESDPEALRPNTRALRGYILAKMGRIEESRRILDDLDESWPGSPTSAFHKAVIHIGLGEHQRALDLLEAAADERSTLARLIKVEPKMEALRSHPRFESLLHRLGLHAADVEEERT